MNVSLFTGEIRSEEFFVQPVWIRLGPVTLVPVLAPGEGFFREEVLAVDFVDRSEIVNEMLLEANVFCGGVTHFRFDVCRKEALFFLIDKDGSRHKSALEHN